MNKIVFTILQRTLVRHFYKVNAGFFLFWFFVLFGIVSGGQVVAYHLSLMEGMVQSPVFLGCVIVIWVLYTFKCINYITQQLNDPRHQFLSVLNRFSNRWKFSYMLFVHAAVYMPVLLYAIAVACMAVVNNHWDSMVAVVVANISMPVFSAIVYKRTLEKKNIGFHPYFPVVTLPKPLLSIPLWFIWKDRKQMLLVTKVFSLLLLYAFVSLYEPDKPDVRPVLLVMTVVVAAHSAIIAQVRVFEEDRLLFTRNLPVPFLQRLGALWVQYGLLLLPEFLFMWKGFPLHFQVADMPQILVLSIGLASFFHSLLMMKDLDMGTYYKTVFGTWAALFFVLLYNPGIILPVIVIAAASLIYHSHLYDFEKKEAERG